MEPVPIKPWIDVTLTLSTDMVVWRGDPPFYIRKKKTMERDNMNLSEVTMSVHAGTHMDSPLHFIKDGLSIDQMPIATTVGHSRVICINDRESIKADELKKHAIKEGQRILFKTVNSTEHLKRPQFYEKYVYLTEEGADYLVSCKISLVGIDYYSIAQCGSSEPVHRTLLGAGIWIIESLDLSEVSEGNYDLVCLPLKIADSDGSPVRAILRKLQ
ncbi:cyclase family protein [Candidatus Magnetomonas plexicatena]|uniref:cyclase family protein n=1 Tax=Candidatus Magnetomonas plexicatena TaxID=2552947 RepID=UPI001C781F5F|nr:cyclase family protein [Nitrospirales bacterium LBB_01]